MESDQDLELTDEERNCVWWLITDRWFHFEKDKELTPDGKWKSIILKLQAWKVRAEFYTTHSSYELWSKGSCEECGRLGLFDPRHAWKDEQWMEAAQVELSREDKG